MQKRKYELRCFDRRAICPVCGTMMVIHNEEVGYICSGCKLRLCPVEAGKTDREVVCIEADKE